MDKKRIRKFGDKFIQEFFTIKNDKSTTKNIQSYFYNGFVIPNNFETILEKIKPIPGYKKIVMISGHPRTGKTWMAVGAIAKLLDMENIDKSGWWTSGLDSLKLRKGKNEYLNTTLEKIGHELSQIRDKGKLRIIFLDELLGTNKPFPFKRRGIKKYFVWDENNPILRNLPENSSLVITGRSLHFFLLETIIQGINVSRYRKIERKRNSVILENIKWGIFRSVDNYELTGSFDEEKLLEVTNNIKKYHPFKEESTWLTASAPLLAFNEDLNENDYDNAAITLFGEDMDALVERIHDLNIEASGYKTRPNWINKCLETLETAYIISIAPGLLYLGEIAYDSLGISKGMVKKIADAMYYSDNKFRSGRLPNEFYMRAMDINLNEKLSLSTKTYYNFLLRSTATANKTLVQHPGLGLILRGFIERSLHRCTNWTIDDLLDKKEIKKLIALYLADKKNKEASEDFLIRFELHNHWDSDYDINEQSLSEKKAGIAAAIGWALGELISVDEHKKPIFKRVMIWYENFLFHLFYIYIVYKHEKLIDSRKLDEEWDIIASFYSTFLQWGLKNEEVFMSTKIISQLAEIAINFNKWFQKRKDQIERHIILDNLSRISGNNTNFETIDIEKIIGNYLSNREFIEQIESKLSNILEDELIWAFLEHKEKLSFPYLSIPKIKSFMKFFTEKQSLNKNHFMETNKQTFRFVNRFFSLSWHNEWMQSEANLKNEYYDRLKDLRQWMDKNKKESLKIINGNPYMLYDNLQYHWCHFVAQRSTWMRDWCFHEDPVRYEIEWYDTEFSLIARGSNQKIDHNYFSDIVKTILESNYKNYSDEDRSFKLIRNVFMLVGLRMSKIDNKKAECILEIFDDYFSSNKRNRNAILISYLLQPIFEFARQGFFEASSRTLPNKFREWCLSKLGTNAVSEINKSWGKYWKEIDRLTSPLDLMPDLKDGWRQIFPMEIQD